MRRALSVALVSAAWFWFAEGSISAQEQRASSTGSPPVAQSEKALRTPAQRKLSSQLVYEIDRAKGQANQKLLPPERGVVRIDGKHRALVDVRVVVTPAITRQLVRLGSTIVSTAAEAQSVIAWVPLLKLEQLARSPSVRAIEPAAEPLTNNQPETGKR